jgi:hypothetical protein
MVAWALSEYRKPSGEIPLTLIFFLDQSQPCRLRDIDHRRLAGAVNRDRRLSATAGQGRYVDDFSTVALLDHLPGRRLQCEQQPFHVDRKYFVVVSPALIEVLGVTLTVHTRSAQIDIACTIA